MRAPLLRVLRSTVAVGAVALGSASANAACTAANGVVTCSDVNTSEQVNASLSNAPPPSVSLVITQGAAVVRNFSSQLSPSGFRFPDAIGYTNSGAVGTPGANVDFVYFGSNNANPGNTFTFDNRGTQNGGVFAFNVGGAITGTNSGTVTRGIDLRGTGAVNFTNTGSVFNTSTFGGGTAIALTSSRTTFTTGADGTSRFEETGGPLPPPSAGRLAYPPPRRALFSPKAYLRAASAEWT